MNKRTRAFVLLIAVLFFATSVGFTGLVIWEMTRNKDQANQAQEPPGTPEATQNEQPQEDTLQGTKLDNFTPIGSVDKLQTTDLKEGDGAVAKADSTVTAHYTGALAKDGTIFESSKDSGQPATFPLNQVIQGWQQGVPGMKVGGTRRLVIPAELAYGKESPSPNIPPNSDLVFDIELVSIK